MRVRTLAMLLGGFLVCGLALAQTSQSQRFAVPLSDPNQPAVVKASLTYGSIKAVAYQGTEIVVEAVFEQEEEEIEEVDGMKRIPSYSLGMTIEEDDNVVRIDTDWTDEEIFLSLKVPARTSLQLKCVNGDYIEVEGVQGDHELSHINGEIRAIDIRGSVIADTTNGDVNVRLLELTADKPMSFATWNGDVDISFPPSLKADVRMKSAHGDVYTDFDLALQPIEPKVTREESQRGYRVKVEQSVQGTVGGGGPEMAFKTFNGDIFLRKLK